MRIPKADRNLLGLTRAEHEEVAQACGQPRYRAGQIYHAIYARRQTDFSKLTDLDKAFRMLLSDRYSVRYPEIRQRVVSCDGAVRYVLGLEDGGTVEAVYMPEEGRATLCISSQVGCAVDCRFCFTGLLGLARNLTAGEIVGQVLALAQAQDLARHYRLNVVFMGMGEPLLNLGQVMKAVMLLADPRGVEIPLGRITISTSGIVPRIQELGREPDRKSTRLNSSHLVIS